MCPPRLTKNDHCSKEFYSSGIIYEEPKCNITQGTMWLVDSADKLKRTGCGHGQGPKEREGIQPADQTRRGA